MSETLDPMSPEVRAAVADLSLAVQRALLCIHKHRRAQLAMAVPVLEGPIGPAGATGPAARGAIPSYAEVGNAAQF